jgi:YgiT-type zinc finger domain-containing protein
VTEAEERPTVCDQCQVALVERAITHEVLLGQERFDIEGVPALECPQCGLRWITAEALETIDRIIQENS